MAQGQPKAWYLEKLGFGHPPAKFHHIVFHSPEDVCTVHRELSGSLVGASKWIFIVDLNRAVKICLGEHGEELGEFDHTFP